MRGCDAVQFLMLLLILGASSATLAQLQGNDLSGETIAQVNGDAITRSGYEQSPQLLEKRLQRNFTGAELQGEMAQEEKKLLRTLIEDRLLSQRAKALNIWPDNEAIKYLDWVRQQYKLPDMEALEEWIMREGIDREELMANLKSQSLRNQVFRREVF